MCVVVHANVNRIVPRREGVSAKEIRSTNFEHGGGRMREGE